MGLSTLFRTSSLERERQAKRAAIGLNIQVYAVVIFALIAIVGPFFAAEAGDIDADQSTDHARPPTFCAGDGRNPTRARKG